MVKKNFRLRLYNNVQVCTNITIDSDSEKHVIYRFLGFLRQCNTIGEQLTAINEITPCRGYSKTADETYYYDANKDVVEVRKCIYDTKRDTFRRGKLIDTITWEGGKVKSINNF